MVALNIPDGRVQNGYYGIPAFKNLMTASISDWGDWEGTEDCVTEISVITWVIILGTGS